MNARAVEARVLSVAPWLLGLSLAVHFGVVVAGSRTTMLDLSVYRDGAPALLRGDLYGWHSSQHALPFTYPPFAAALFLPLSALSWLAVRWLWQIGSVASLWWFVRLTFRLIATDTAADTAVGGAAANVWRRRTMFWTGAAIWLEPVRTTLNFGQINLMLAALVLAGMVAARPELSGLGIGVTAGIKLTPALSVIYFLATRRWVAAAWSVVAFAGTVAVAALFAPAQSRLYWFHLFGQADRIGTVGSARNQSLRAALSRSVGHDIGSGPLWLIAVAVAAVVLWCALRAAARAGDTLASVVSVQIFTLLVSPISWSHHWVWMVPALLWLLYGRAAGGRLVVASAVAWLAATGTYLVSFLALVEDTLVGPWYAAILAWVYPVCGMLTLLTVAVTLRRARSGRTGSALSREEYRSQPVGAR